MKNILKIKLTFNNLYVKVFVNDILRLEGSENYTYIYRKDGIRFISGYTLKYIEEMLPKNLFLRVHKKHLVNIKSIKYFNSELGKSKVFLKTGDIVSVSRRKNREIGKGYKDGLFDDFKFAFGLVS